MCISGFVTYTRVKTLAMHWQQKPGREKLSYAVVRLLHYVPNDSLSSSGSISAWSDREVGRSTAAVSYRSKNPSQTFKIFHNLASSRSPGGTFQSN